MDDRCVAFCDSGAGGLLLLKKIADAYPRENFIYLADSENLPYGDKSAAELAAIGDGLITRLNTFSPKLIVTACNTLSVTMAENRKDYGVKIVGVFPKITAGEGYVFCTPRTAESSYAQKLASQGATVVGIKGLAEDVENSLINGKTVDFNRYFSTFSKTVDYVSIGCTHYGFLLREFQKEFPYSAIIDGAEIAERRIRAFLDDHRCNRERGSICFLGNKREKISGIYRDF